MYKKWNKDEILIESNGECLEVVNRAVNRSGYTIVQNGKNKIAYHRLVWEKANGKLLPKQVVRQSCGNRKCCNLDHLVVGTQADDITYDIDDNGCFVCTSHKPCQYGYPQGRDKIVSTGCTEYLHRIVYKRNYGPIEKGLVVRHKCDNRMCVNPEHLELGTTYENTQDMVSRGRSAKGECVGNSKLKEADVIKIKQMLADGYRQIDIAAEFKVSQHAISAIKCGKTWRP